MKWDTEEDRFMFKIKLNFSEKRRKIHTGPNLQSIDVPSALPDIITKRQILSQLSGVWDPQGFAAPIIVKGKIGMRKLWRQDLDWDDPVTPDAKNEWCKFFKDLFLLEEVSFPRCLRPEGAVGNPSLIVFCDGSEEAYGAVAYVRWLLKDGKHASHLILAKCKISPIKMISIVRLELNGAVLGIRIKSFIFQHSRYKFERVIFIVDSKIVHAMIKKESYGFNTFVALRVGEIQHSSEAIDWYWVESSQNIADWVTRASTSPTDMGEGSKWQAGPTFLSLPVEQWPVVRDASEVDIPELRKTVMLAKGKIENSLASRIDINRFSCYQRLINTTARILRLFKRFKGDNKQTSVLRISDIEEAETFWIHEAQRELSGRLNEKSLLRLCAREVNGKIIVGGRAERWMEATWNRQSFILLPQSHRLSFLIAASEHVRIGHLGISSTVATIRAKYWIFGVRKIVKKIRSNCLECKKRLLKFSRQIMSDLPVERLRPSPPFTNVGIDYFGPYTIKGEVQKRVRGKCYGVLIVCMTMRAVYADIAQNYSTDGFLQVLRRFGSRHGWPSNMYSDQGTQLMAASSELKTVISGVDVNSIQELAVAHKTTWKFCPPDAPWMNGVTESLVKSIKRSINNAIGDHVLSFSEIQTTTFECSQLVNERPIGRHPTDPEDGSYLCPNDLLLGRSTSCIPQGPFTDDAKLSRRFCFIQCLVDHFWKKWTREYFPSLLVRSKWHVSKREVKIGDIVLIKDSNAIRGKWRLGRVMQTYPSVDGRVRKVSVLCKPAASDASGSTRKLVELERAVHNLIVIATNEKEEEEEEEEEDEEEERD